jgi:MgtC family
LNRFGAWRVEGCRRRFNLECGFDLIGRLACRLESICDHQSHNLAVVPNLLRSQRLDARRRRATVAEERHLLEALDVFRGAAGTILRRDEVVLGVTTAATLWLVTVVGLCLGGGQIALGVAGTVLGVVVLNVLR